ncbi:cupin domain-containing protein [Candidatus Woesearchaeota archaeon]|nr:cupin domain-containing protein [Candidatus Woesearchaeota archaeon]MBT4732544.1 cupin domain-containing protein [Candidatus Woesearchaeota archaeon]MBT7558759.1 cupin domain-containing protein [Candidatus Woesearchaeota archaeon]
MELEMEIHDKSWGYEKWIVNKKEYCGKLLFFKKGKHCSFHYHKIKDEVFYLQSGSIIVRYSNEDNLEESKKMIMEPGDTFHVSIGLRHQMLAIEDSELFEFSTQHFEDDSYRIIKGD